MDQHKQALMQLRLEHATQMLRKNNFDAHIIPDKQALIGKMNEYLPSGASCGVGGSMTLFESGVMEYLQQKGDITFYDRYAKNADIDEVYHQSMTCDVYISSTNAVTEDGFLYNMDGVGNRVAAMIYGPKKVVVIAGYNKLVPNLEAAREQVKSVAAPANCIRLALPNPCAKSGYCQDCQGDTRICCTEVVLRKQRIKNRIAVLLLPMELGY